jgi:hypothetical protein
MRPFSSVGLSFKFSSNEACEAARLQLIKDAERIRQSMIERASAQDKPISIPTRFICAGCCARATSGHAAAAPPRSVMKARRFIFRLIQSPRRRGRATSDERCESLKINMFRMPCGLVAAWAAQHERFEGGHTAVWTRYVVVGDLDRGEVAALRPGS